MRKGLKGLRKMGKGLKRNEIDRLSLKALKIALASGLRNGDYLYALRRYLRLVEALEKGRV